MKRAIVCVVLLAMMLHCSVRLGFVTWLYQNRQAIAYSIGLMEEQPITMCGHAHDLDRSVEIKISHDESDKLPVSTFQAREINLFFEITIARHSPQYLLLRENQIPREVEKYYLNPEHDIFHPPA